jgi:catalase
MATEQRFTNATCAPVADNTNIMTAGPRGPALLQDIWLIEKLAHFDRGVIPERAAQTTPIARPTIQPRRDHSSKTFSI